MNIYARRPPSKNVSRDLYAIRFDGVVPVLDTNYTHRVVNPGDARTSFARWLEAKRASASSEPRTKIITNIFNNTITLNGGSLGSWVDEERS